MADLHVAFEIPVLRVGVWPANADYSLETTPGIPDYQFRAVVLATAAAGVTGYAGAGITVPSSSGGVILGVLQTNPIKNEAGDVWLAGISKVVLGANVTNFNQVLKVDSSGKFQPAGSGDFGVAMALCLGSAGEIIAAYIHNYGKQ